MKLRRFTIKDYDEVHALWVESGLEIRPGDSKRDVRLKLKRDPELFLVAVEGGRIVGAAMGAWDGRRGWIYHLGVLPAFQRKGVASAMVSEIEKRMARKGVLKVNATVYEWNEKSRRFFGRAGYTVGDRSLTYGKLLKAAEGEGF